MSLELNKISAAILVAGLIGMVSGKIASGIYLPPAHHGDEAPKRGYQVEVTEVVAGDTAAAPAGPGSVIPLLASADVAVGQEITKRCVSCHSFEKGGANKVGPAMWGIVNRDVGKAAGFAYSEAMANFGGKWDYDNLSEFLYAPKAHIAGTKMAYAGLKKDEDRAALIAYMRTLSDSPAALPSAAEVAAATPAATEEEGVVPTAEGEKTADKPAAEAAAAD